MIRVALISVIVATAAVSAGHANVVTKRTDTYLNIVHPHDRFGIDNVGKILRGVLDTNGLPMKLQDRVEAVKLPVLRSKKTVVPYQYSRG